MKSFIFSTLLFALILLVIVTNSLYVHRVCDELAELAHAATPTSLTTADALCEAWQRHRTYFSLSIHEEQIERMDDITQGLKSATANHDRAEFEKNLFLLEELLEEFLNNEVFSLQGII